jgi:Icc-related predicted phosphoesterase
MTDNTLKISLCSDLHLEHCYQELPGGDVLILAGDICEYRTLKKEFHKTKLEDRVLGKLKSYDFFYNECAKYEKVFMVMGNHEHYHHRFDKTYEDLKDILPNNVILLEQEVAEYKGVMFLGATLWTDLNRGDPITSWHLKSAMNDYKVVQNHYPAKDLYHKLTPEHTAEVHFKTKQYFKTVLETNRDKPFVVITHHSPSFQSVDDKYKHDTTMNGGYASELSEFILDHDNIKVWVHGHMHDPVDYMVGDTRVLANPRGYIPWEENNGFNPNLVFEI